MMHGRNHIKFVSFKYVISGSFQIPSYLLFISDLYMEAMRLV